MKYVESLGKTSFDWRGFLNKEKYTKEEVVEAEELVMSYATSPLGNLCESIPRLTNGRPRDRGLVMSDTLFEESILSGNYRNAKSILDDIEAREKQILEAFPFEEKTKPSYDVYLKEHPMSKSFDAVNKWSEDDTFLVFTRSNGDQVIVPKSDIFKIELKYNS